MGFAPSRQHIKRCIFYYFAQYNRSRVGYEYIDSAAQKIFSISSSVKRSVGS